MLRLHVVRGQGVGYYVRDLVPGRAEETRVAGESPGRWAGRGSGDLGLAGPVDARGITEVLAGHDPASGQALRQAHTGRPVSGFDLTFCAPKSVSVLHLLAPAELGAAVGGAHREAVADAVAYVERHGHGVRRNRSGQVHHLGTTGVVAAAFDHRTSRTLDPHLHTHLVVANVALGVDGRWSSLDSRRLFLHRRATGAVYDASLRHHLTAAAGVAWRRSPTGGWEVDGVDPVLCRLLSQRSASIDEHAHVAGGRRSAGRRRVAFFADRPDKVPGRTVDGLQAGWRRRLADVGIDPGELIGVVGRVRLSPEAPSVDAEALRSGLEWLGAHRSRLTPRDLVAVVADAAPGGLSGSAAVRGADALFVELSDPGPGRPTGRRAAWVPARVAGLVEDAPDLVGRALEERSLRRPPRDVGREADVGRRGPDGMGLVR